MYGTENFVAMEAEVTLKWLSEGVVRLVTSCTGSINSLAGSYKGYLYKITEHNHCMQET